MKATPPKVMAALLAVVLIVCLGCEKETEGSKEDVLVKIGERTLTDVQLNRATEACLSTYLTKKDTRAASRKRDTEKLRSRAEAKSLVAEINYMLVAGSEKGRDGEPSADEVKKVEDDYSVSYFGTKGRFGDFAAVLPQEDFKVICDQVRKLATVSAFADRHYADRYRVSEQDIATAWTNIVEHNKLIDATNACIYAMAHDLVRRARDGEDFSKLADAHSQDECGEPGGVLPGLHMDDYAYDKPAVWAAISALKSGEVTEPLDSEDGLAIFKLVSVTNCLCSGEESSEEKDYHLQRIILHRALKVPYESVDELATEMRAQKKREMWRQIVMDLTTENPLSFPSGFEKFSSDSLFALRAYSRDVPKPKLNKLESMVLKALKAKKKQQKSHDNDKE